MKSNLMGDFIAIQIRQSYLHENLVSFRKIGTQCVTPVQSYHITHCETIKIRLMVFLY